VCPVLVHLIGIAEMVAVGVTVERVGIVFMKLFAVAEAIVVGIDSLGIGKIFLSFVGIDDAVAIGVGAGWIEEIVYPQKTMPPPIGAVVVGGVEVILKRRAGAESNIKCPCLGEL